MSNPSRRHNRAASPVQSHRNPTVDNHLHHSLGTLSFIRVQTTPRLTLRARHTRHRYPTVRFLRTLSKTAIHPIPRPTNRCDKTGHGGGKDGTGTRYIIMRSFCRTTGFWDCFSSPESRVCSQLGRRAGGLGRFRHFLYTSFFLFLKNKEQSTFFSSWFISALVMTHSGSGAHLCFCFVVFNCASRPRRTEERTGQHCRGKQRGSDVWQYHLWRMVWQDEQGMAGHGSWRLGVESSRLCFFFGNSERVLGERSSLGSAEER